MGPKPGTGQRSNPAQAVCWTCNQPPPEGETLIDGTCLRCREVGDRVAEANPVEKDPAERRAVRAVGSFLKKLTEPPKRPQLSPEDRAQDKLDKAKHEVGVFQVLAGLVFAVGAIAMLNQPSLGLVGIVAGASIFLGSFIRLHFAYVEYNSRK